MLTNRPHTARLRGVVLDSLLGVPLQGATVRVLPLGRITSSDSGGRFAFDSLPVGEWTVAFRHPALDSLGFAESGAQVRVFAGTSTFVTLGTESLETFREPFCASTPDSLSETVAYGSVHSDAGPHSRVDVSVSWLSMGAAGDGSPTGTVRTVPDGEQQVWVACGVPPGAWLRASVKDATREASALLQLGPRHIVMRPLVLANGTGPLNGTVRTAAGVAIGGARISIVDSDVFALADSAGAFTLTVPKGTYTLDVRAAGYRAWLAAVDGDQASIDVRLHPLVAPQVDAPRGSDYLRLMQRGARRGLLLLTPSDFAADSSALTALVPTGTCRWWLDGRPVSRETFTAQPRPTWRALEMYARGEDAPPEYRAAGCAVALLWTAAADW